MKKPLLILDLDETLIYSTHKKEYKNEKYDFIIDEDYYVKKRPFVDEFLIEISNHFELAVWTAATRDYGEYIIKELFEKNNLSLKFFYSREKCVQKEHPRSMYDYYAQRYYIKDLNKIKKEFDLNKVLMLDDLHISLERNYGNLVKVNPFQGDNNDTHLISVKEFLLSVKDTENLRQMEKRYWQEELKINSYAEETERKKLKM